MLELLSKIICFVMMTISGFYIIKTITKSETNFHSAKTMLLLLILVIIQCLLYKIQYTSTYTLIIYLLNIIVYKEIFNQNIIQSTISTSMLMILSFFGDLITSIIIMNFFTIAEARGIWYVMIISNLLSCIIAILICFIPWVKNLLFDINRKIQYKRNVSNIIFFTLIIIVFTMLAYNFYSKFGWNISYISNIIIFLIFGILMVIFINEKNHNDKLTTEYDNLFNYVQTFEDWIEKEQLNRHEYKNQLAVLRCMTKDKNVISKIDEILEDSINVEGEVANQLKSLPKGGMKGLMYYKSSIAQKKKVKLAVDVSIERHSLLEKLTEKDMRILCKLIGIYFDNAIEAALETRKKVVCVEIYELNDHVSFVISNTFKQHKNMDKRNEKGVSSKGEGHGNGLYFASKLISKNDWLSQKQDIVDKYYIQTLVIKKPDTK